MKVFITVVLFTMVASTASATFTQQWKFDVASYDYNTFTPHYERWGRIHYRSEGQPLVANTIDNGDGPVGKPVLEVYLTGGMSHGEAEEGGVPHVPGSVYCLNGATGDVIWHKFLDGVYVHTMMELADCTGDGHLDLLVADYRGIYLLNARNGDTIWEVSWTNPGNTPEVVNKRLDKHNSIIRDPKDGIVYVYTSTDGGPIHKRIGSTGQSVASSFATTRPCFGGQTAGDIGNGNILIIEGSGYPGIYAFDLDLNLVWQDLTFTSTGGTPVLYDVNNDGYLDVVLNSASSYSNKIGVINGLASWENRVGVGTGTAIWLKSPTSTGISGHNAPAVADFGDGNLRAVMGWSTGGGVWSITNWNKMSFSSFESGYTPAVGNVWGDSNLEVIDTPYYKVYDKDGALVYSLNKISSSPLLIADLDGDGYNEIVGDGSQIFNVPGSPWGGNVWSWGWNVCYKTPGESLNPKNEVLSQEYNQRRTGVDVIHYEYLWESPGFPPDIPGFEVIFVLLSITMVYLLTRRKRV